MADWIWSDLHLYHPNIINYEKRPFTSVQEQTEHLIDAWKKTVKKGDRLFNNGDFALKVSKDDLTSLIKNLPGRKILILGNHDRRHSVKWWLEAGFDEVSKYPIIVDKFWILSHEPLYVGKESPYANIHGHTHSTNMDNPYMFNVSVENIGYKPVLLEDVKKTILERVGSFGKEVDLSSFKEHDSENG